jgi:hypothetical protein
MNGGCLHESNNDIPGEQAPRENGYCGDQRSGHATVAKLPAAAEARKQSSYGNGVRERHYEQEAIEEIDH